MHIKSEIEEYKKVLAADYERIKTEYDELQQKYRDLEEQFENQQKLLEKKEEKLDFTTKALFFVTRFLSILVIVLITVGDYYQQKSMMLRMDIGSILLGIILIVIISLSLRGGPQSPTQTKILRNVSNIAILGACVIFFGVTLLVCYITFTHCNAYFYQIAIIGILAIPFGTLQGYNVTRHHIRHLAVLCIGAFLGFVLGVTFYFTFLEADVLRRLINTVRLVINDII